MLESNLECLEDRSVGLLGMRQLSWIGSWQPPMVQKQLRTEKPEGRSQPQLLTENSIHTAD